LVIGKRIAHAKAAKDAKGIQGRLRDEGVKGRRRALGFGVGSWTVGG